MNNIKITLDIPPRGYAILAPGILLYMSLYLYNDIGDST